MGLLQTIEFEHKRVTPATTLNPFQCKSEEINKFYCEDIILHSRSLIAVSYVLETPEHKVLGFYCVSNDRIDTKYKKIGYIVPFGKLYNGAPAVKIGRLGVNTEFERQGIGSDILDYIKYSFTHGNKTGCRFIIVDAHNNLRTIKFYEKNEFKFLTKEDKRGETRLMYFDLMRYATE